MKKQKIKNFFSSFTHYGFLLFLAFYLIESTHFYFTKKLITANVKSIRKTGNKHEIELNFNYKGKEYTIKKTIHDGVYDAIKNKPNVEIYFSDFLDTQIYFKDRLPYFLIRLLFNYLIFLILAFPGFFLRIYSYFLLKKYKWKLE